MKTLSVKLSKDQAAQLERLAMRRRTTKSAIMREALEEELRPPTREPSVCDLMKDSVGSIDSGIRDLGHNRVRQKGFGLK
jgi:predicted transcriptional regulator